MKERPNADYWLVTTERYASDTRYGNFAEHRFLSPERAKDFALTQISTGAFVRITIELVQQVECLYWRDCLGE